MLLRPLEELSQLVGPNRAGAAEPGGGRGIRQHRQDVVAKDAQALGLLATITPSTLLEWKTEMEGRTLDEDKLMRISLLIGIFKALNLCHGQDLADSWVTLLNQNPIFAGEAPVDYRIQHGRPGMEQVRRLLDALCDGRG